MTFISKLAFLFAVRYLRFRTKGSGDMFYMDMVRRQSIFKTAWQYARMQRKYDGYHKHEMSWRRPA